MDEDTLSIEWRVVNNLQNLTDWQLAWACREIIETTPIPTGYALVLQECAKRLENR